MDDLDLSQLRQLLAALLKRHTTGTARFTLDELAAPELCKVNVHRGANGDIWLSLDGPSFVDSPLES
jgi:hypothetical protein